MPEKPRIEDLELSDAELVELIRSHGVDRRSILKALGLGSVLSLGAGTAAAGEHSDPSTPAIDPHYGYAAPTDEGLPEALRPDHVVELHIHEHAIFSPTPTDLPFHFEPVALKVDVGDTVRFNFETPEHTITAYHQGQGREQRVPNDKPPFSSPVINAGGFWLYEFDSPGTYDLFCAPHEPFGMVMRIVVGDPSDENYDGSFEPTGRPPFSRAELTLAGVPEWPYPMPNAVFQTDSLAVENISSSGVSVGAVESDLGDLPIVTKLMPREVPTNTSDAKFDVDWEVWDPNGYLKNLQLVMIDLADGTPEGPPQSELVSGGSASGTTSFTATDDEDEEHDYVVEATVSNILGNSSSSAVPVSEDPSI